jgi:hypothetical protein
MFSTLGYLGPYFGIVVERLDVAVVVGNRTDGSGLGVGDSFAGLARSSGYSKASTIDGPLDIGPCLLCCVGLVGVVNERLADERSSLAGTPWSVDTLGQCSTDGANGQRSEFLERDIGT